MTERVSDAGLQWFIGDHGPDTMAGRIARELLERREADAWRPIESAPVMDAPLDCLLYGPNTGVREGKIFRTRSDWPTAGSIANLGGDAIQDWGVTLWRPLPAPEGESA